MIDFKTVELTDKEWMDKHFREENSRSSEFCFTNAFTWGNIYNLTVAEVEGTLIYKSGRADKAYYSFPIGNGDLRSAIVAVTRDAYERGVPFVLRSITVENAEKIDILFPCYFKFTKQRDVFDYVYSAEKLATLSGKQLHSKRNHINRFEQTYKWSFEPIDETNLSVCVDLNAEWVKRHMEEGNSSDISGEIKAIEKVFNNYKALGLEGGILWADGRPVAFTIGEKLSSDTYIVHYEKAFSDINGAYPMINREFVRYIINTHPEIVYINREDDMGSENLRKAKKSYYPEFMVEKFIAEPGEGSVI